MQIDSTFGDHGPMPKLLLVEDNPLHVRLVRSMLVDVWPEVDDLRHTRKLETAIAMVHESEPACILLDLILPDAEGLEGVVALLEEAPNIPIVVLSSHEDDVLAMEAIAGGAQDYLVKGTIGPEVLARSIQFAIQRHQFDGGGAGEVESGAAETAAGTAVLDDKGAILFSEVEVADMLGHEVGDMIGSSVSDLTHQNDLSSMEDALQAAAPEVTVRMRHASGSDLLVRIELEPLADGERDTAAFLARYYPQIEPGTVSSGAAFAVMSDWVGA
jgi:DNA-binding NarL/FixJ family response regulator